MDDENKFLLDLPQTDEPKEEKPRENCLQEIIIEIMNERGLKDAELVRDTGIPFSTFWGWVSGEVRSPLVDKNLKTIHRYFGNVPYDYLLFGIGKDHYTYDFSGAKGWDGFQERIKTIRNKRKK